MEQVDFQSKDGTRLAGYRWPAPRSSRGTILIVHGLAEHAGRYGHVARRLTDAGWTVVAVDLRGHGRSDGKRGHVSRWADYTADVEAAITQLTTEPPLLLAHSMGGLVALDFVREHAAAVRGLVLSAPLLGLLLEVPAWKRALAVGLSRVVPSLALPSDVRPDHLSHDRAVVDAYTSDPLVFRTATARWFRELTKAMRRVREAAPGGSLPVFVTWGTDDRIVDPLAIAAWCSAWGGKVKAVTPHGLYHEVLNEPGDEVMAPMIAWLEAHAAPARAAK
jgi:lysophospholipase